MREEPGFFESLSEARDKCETALGLVLVFLALIGGTFSTCWGMSFARPEPPEVSAIPAAEIDAFVVDIDDAVHSLRGQPTEVAKDTLRDWAVYGTLIQMRLDPNAVARASRRISPVRAKVSAESTALARGSGRSAVVRDEEALVFVDANDPDPARTIQRLMGEIPRGTGVKPVIVHVFRICADVAAAEIRVERVSSEPLRSDAGSNARHASILEEGPLHWLCEIVDDPTMGLTAKPGRGGRSSPRSTHDSTYDSTHDSTRGSTHSENSSPFVPWKNWTAPKRPRHAPAASVEIGAKPDVTTSQSSGMRIAIMVLPGDRLQVTQNRRLEGAAVAEENLAILSGGRAEGDRVKLRLMQRTGDTSGAKPDGATNAAAYAPTPGEVVAPAQPRPVEPELQKALDSIQKDDARGALKSMLASAGKAPRQMASVADAFHGKVTEQADQYLARGAGLAAGSLYELAAEVESEGSTELELRRAMADIQSGRAQRGLSRLGDLERLSPEAIARLEGTPMLGDLPGYLAARRNPSQQILGVPARELELVVDGTELRSALKIDRFPAGEQIAMQDRAQIAASPADTVFYIDDRISLNRHDLETSGHGSLAEIAASPDVEWEAVMMAGEVHLPGFLIDKSDGKRYRQAALEDNAAPEGPPRPKRYIRIHHTKPPRGPCDKNRDGIVTKAERASCGPSCAL